MKVAIDSGPLKSGHTVRGIGAHTRELITALKLITKNEKPIKLDVFDFSANSQQLAGNSYDILHYTSFHPFFVSLPWRKPKKTKIILTIHDLIPLIYPQHYPAGIKGKIRLVINKFLIQKNVDVIITISETSKKDICRFLGVHPDKVFVVYLAPRKIFRPITDHRSLITVQRKYRLPDSFALYVGDVNYNKNILTLLKACRLAKIPLVICGKQALEIETLGREDLTMLKGPKDWIRYLFGKPHPELAHFKELIKEFENNKKVIRLGFVPESDLAAIYNLAAVYVQPSFYEGFGLPVLEALASGCPVVSTKIQSLVEIGEAACLFVDPKDPKDMAAKISSVLEDDELRKQLVETGKVLVKNYSWDKTASETAKVYRVVNGK